MKKGKIVRIVATVFIYLFVLLCLVILIFSLSSKKINDDALSLFGYQMRIVISPSMEECELTNTDDYEIKSLKVETMIFVEEVPNNELEKKEWYSNLVIGDVITFKYVFVRQEVVTHRIVDKIDNGNGGYLLYLQGDNRNSPEGVMTQVIDTSAENSSDYVIGKVVGQSYFLGRVVSFLKSTMGLLLVIIIPSFLIIVFEIIKIFNLLSYKRKMVEAEKQKQQQDEIAELKRKIELLEQKNNS